MGKLCLLNQLWAQEAIKPLVKLLSTTQDLPTLLNIIYVLRDLCVRYVRHVIGYILCIYLIDINRDLPTLFNIIYMIYDIMSILILHFTKENLDLLEFLAEAF